jgi:hypothetical protein
MSTTQLKLLIATSFAALVIAVPSAQAQKWEYAVEHQPHGNVKDEWLARKLGICHIRELPGTENSQAYENDNPLHPAYFTKVTSQPSPWELTGASAREFYNRAANPLHPSFRR